MTRAVARSRRPGRRGRPRARHAPRRAPRPQGRRRPAAPRRGWRSGGPASALGQWLRRPLTSLHLVLGVFGLLTLFGLVMVLSASSVEAYTAGGSSYSVFTKQLLFCVPGLAMFYLGLRIPPRQLRALAPAFLVRLRGAADRGAGRRRHAQRLAGLVRRRVVHRAALGGGEGGAHAVGRARAGGAAGGDAPVEVRAVAGRARHGRAVHAARAGARPRHDGHARHRAGRAAVLRGRAAAADGRAVRRRGRGRVAAGA